MTVVVQLIWLTSGDGSLSPTVRERLGPYITRYAQTMGVTVFAVGGEENHLHILFALPRDKTIRTIDMELRKTTTRFVRETLSVSGFTWSEDTVAASISHDEMEEAAAYINDNAGRHASGDTVAIWENSEEEAVDETLPEWLRNVRNTP